MNVLAGAFVGLVVGFAVAQHRLTRRVENIETVVGLWLRHPAVSCDHGVPHTGNCTACAAELFASQASMN